MAKNIDSAGCHSGFQSVFLGGKISHSKFSKRGNFYSQDLNLFLEKLLSLDNTIGFQSVGPPNHQ
ncbi:hypothetical protein PsalMR5_04547 (plasmid) [Piscirickettsia salmonis]|uniref:hypothetical protein n=1 Tax=Piscirickettsia salmonis TaxID=1238 RepID=UPI0012BA8A69|nr:hypothetical protein [Piscirickettsia salmonis]QGP56972.1 hypothetical protein PsalSR1_04461 [Piscirickettsia salmonis]QGP61789.1 hypothetical protein PsalBI1_04431 [Piscirickettsia salmonis]QGP66622.1 hypothetical protein PsalMR5_04547 [Piscirickettsia salmonis]